MAFNLAIAYLLKESQVQKFKDVMDFNLLETLLQKNKLQEYLDLKERLYNSTEKHIRSFQELYPALLSGELTELDINVYLTNFEPGQNIKYFRDFFCDTRETENYTSRGSNIELRAYGDSSKINREVISFTGNFKEDLLTSFNDKTSETLDYISKVASSGERDFYENDKNLVELLVKNKLLNILHQDTLNDIVYKQPAVLAYLHKEGFLDKISKDTVNRVVSNSKIIFRYIIENDLIDLLTHETIKEVVDGDINSIKKNVFLLKKNVTEKEFIYDPAYEFFLADSYVPNDLQSSLQGTKFNNSYKTHFKIKDVIENIKFISEDTTIYDKNNEYHKVQIDKIEKVYVSNAAKELFHELESIQNIANGRVQKIKDEVAKKRRRKNIVYLIILLLIGFFFTKNYFNKKNRSTEYATTSAATETTVNTLQPGGYFISEENYAGLTYYRDVNKKKKSSVKLKQMQELTIKEIRDSLGFFDSFYDDNSNKINAGWVEMNKLLPSSELISNYKSYTVKSDYYDGIKIYKNYKKTKSFNTRLQLSEQVNIIRMVDGMGYFKDLFTTGGDRISGWVEMDQLY